MRCINQQVLLFIILIILLLVTDVVTASIITTIIVLFKYMGNTAGITEGINNEPEKPVSKKPAPPKLPDISLDILNVNEQALNDILSSTTHTADDRLFDAHIVSGLRSKEAIDIRSHINNDNWKKYYNEEFQDHGDREWWGSDDF